MNRIKVDTSEIISKLLKEVVQLKHILNQRDLTISELNQKLKLYERNI